MQLQGAAQTVFQALRARLDLFVMRGVLNKLLLDPCVVDQRDLVPREACWHGLQRLLRIWKSAEFKYKAVRPIKLHPGLPTAHTDRAGAHPARRSPSASGDKPQPQQPWLSASLRSAT
jgi:hypothetical protein